jgi:glutathione S-transferase
MKGLAMYELYYYPGNASLLPHMALRELAVPFELKIVDRTKDAQKSAAYLKLNPNGRIPVLVDGDVVLFEAAAITMYLADRHPEGGLAPPQRSRERGAFYKWMVHLTNTPQAEFRSWYYPWERVSDGAATDDAKATAEKRLDQMFDLIEAQLGAGPWLLGERFSGADLFLFMLVEWGLGMKRPPHSLPALGTHARRVLARPAVRATLEAEDYPISFD